MKPKNLLFLLGESHAPHLLGAAGNPHVQTPNLDRLAARGLLFDAAYCASPLCVPARAAIATGQFPHESGYWDSSIAYDGAVPSWMHRLRGAGIPTTGIGKMHFRSDADDNGFSDFVETMHIADGVGDLVSALRHEDAEPTYQGLWDIWTGRYGAGDDNPYRLYDQRIAEAAAGWLNQAPASPWALSVHFIAAHAPFVTPRAFHDLYTPADIPPPVRFERGQRPHHPSIQHLRRIVCHDPDVTLDQVQHLRAAYFATLTYLDHLLGRVLAALRASGQEDETLVIYTSDHGFSLGDHYIFGLFHMFEESLRVPMIMAGPGVPARRTAMPVSHVDLYPTILEAFDVPLNDAERGRIGQSLLHDLNTIDSNRAIFAEYHGTGTQTGGFVLRDGALKLIHFVGQPPQLYDLAVDPEESRNLATDPDHAEGLTRLMRQLTDIVDPEAVDRKAKDAQRALIEGHGGKDAVLHKMGGFSYTPPPGMSWRAL